MTRKSARSLTTARVRTRLARDPNASDCAVSSPCSNALATAMTSEVFALPPSDSCAVGRASRHAPPPGAARAYTTGGCNYNTLARRLPPLFSTAAAAQSHASMR